MAVTIKYTGTQIRWPELSVTGKQSVWNPGQIESREDAEADRPRGGLRQSPPSTSPPYLSTTPVRLPAFARVGPNA